MGLIDIIKPLSIVLSSAVEKFLQHTEKNSWECQELNLGLLGEKQERILPLCYTASLGVPKFVKEGRI